MLGFKGPALAGQCSLCLGSGFALAILGLVAHALWIGLSGQGHCLDCRGHLRSCTRVVKGWHNVGRVVEMVLGSSCSL